MPMPKPGRPAGAPPPALIFTKASTCGVLAALALQIYMSRAGFDLAALWESLFTGARQLRTTGPWWATAGLAFATGGAVAAAFTRMRRPSRRLRLLRWTAGAILVLVLADVGHSSSAPEAAAAGLTVAARLAGLGLATVMAALGAAFAMRR
jgi:hypothetical protein